MGDAASIDYPAAPTRLPSPATLCGESWLGVSVADERALYPCRICRLIINSVVYIERWHF